MFKIVIKPFMNFFLPKTLDLLKSVHFKKPVMRSSFLSKSVVIFGVVILKMTTHFERNEGHATVFLKRTEFLSH